MHERMLRKLRTDERRLFGAKRSRSKTVNQSSPDAFVKTAVYPPDDPQDPSIPYPQYEGDNIRV
jgi:hypothetical protein